MCLCLTQTTTLAPTRLDPARHRRDARPIWCGQRNGTGNGADSAQTTRTHRVPRQQEPNPPRAAKEDRSRHDVAAATDEGSHTSEGHGHEHKQGDGHPAALLKNVHAAAGWYWRSPRREIDPAARRAPVPNRSTTWRAAARPSTTPSRMAVVASKRDPSPRPGHREQTRGMFLRGVGRRGAGTRQKRQE